MNTVEYYYKYCQNGEKHNRKLLNKMYPNRIYSITEGFRYDISTTPLIKDLQENNGWERYLKSLKPVAE